MTQSRKKNGDIFEIPLHPYEELFAYAKYINVLKYNENTRYPDILRIYNFFSDKPLESSKDILNKDLIFNPAYIAGGYGMTKLYRKLDSEKVSSDELAFPQIRKAIPFRAEIFKFPIKGWEVISIDNKLQNSSPLTFDDVKHLDSPGLIISIDYLPFRIAAEFYKKKHKDISKDFELDFVQKIILDTVNEMPSFEEIPEKNRFKINA